MPGHTHTPDCGCGDEHEYVVRVTTSREGARVRTDLGRAPVAVRSRVLAALAVHLDVPRALEPLAKGEELPASKANVDARYPVLETLIQRARRDWASFGEQLIEKVVETLRGHSELTAELRAELQELFRAHEAAVLMRFAGVGDKAARQRAVDAGFINPGATVWSNVDVAYRAGVGMPLLMQAVQDADPEVARAQVADVVEAFSRQPMTATETVALDFARKRAARLMRRPIQDIHDAFLGILEPIGAPVAHDGTGGEAKPRPPGEGGAEPSAGERGGAVASDSGRPASRELTADEYAKIRPVIERAILERRSAAQLARDLREAAAGTQLTNDMERVARTELRAAHAEGSYQKLKTQTEAVGIADPLVYKMTSPTGCKQCIRIWGRGGSTRYRLSQVEAWEEQGGNYGRPAASWGPTIGPVHPNCFPAGTLITVLGHVGGKPIEDVQVGDVVLTHRGRWRAVTATMDRVFDGDLVGVHDVWSTPEHPFLCGRGWVAAQALNVGDHVRYPVQVAGPDSDDMPADAIKELGFDAVLARLLRCGVPVPTVYLDCDASDRDVDDEASDENPGLRAQPGSHESVEELALKIGAQHPGAGCDACKDLSIGQRLAAHGCLGSHGTRCAGCRRHLGVHVEAGLGGAPERHPSMGQAADDCGSIDLENLRDLEHRTALVDVHADNSFLGHIGAGHRGSIVHLAVPVGDTKRKRHSGHVFNFSVHEDESYVANGVVVHNCTCGPLLLYVGERQHAAVLDAVEKVMSQIDADRATGA